MMLNFSILLGSSMMKENEMNLSGIFAGVSIGDITMTTEIDKAKNLLDDNLTSYASYLQIVYKPIQGLHLLAKYDYFDFNYDYKNGSIARYSYGFELYPLNMIEIKLQARQYNTDNLDLDLDYEYLLQIHTWF